MSYKKYLIICEDGSMRVLDDPLSIIRDGGNISDNDEIYELGPRLKIKIRLEPVTPTYRDTKTTFGLKDGLGVGDYRG